MNKQEALQIMIPPGQRRKGKWMEGVIQIWVTRTCDKACFGCTQGSNLSGNTGRITPQQFEIAVKTLRDYFGVVGIFGGNPATHPDFKELCEILKHYIPYQRRGLWCNNPLGKGSIMRETFNPAVSNLNVHLDQGAYDEFKRDWPESMPFGLNEDCRHSPPFVAMKDVIEDESERWELISKCDINIHWSAMIGVFRKELRAWFCEIAGSQSMLHQHDPDYPDTGVLVVNGWWKKDMRFFETQVEKHCQECGVPLRGYGELAQATHGIEQTSKTHKDIYKPKKKDRDVEVVDSVNDLQSKDLVFTEYMQGASK